MEKAVTVAKETMEQRLEGMNEFRAQLSDQTRTFIPRLEYQVQHQALIDKMDIMEKRMQGVELLKADVTGRIWTLGIVVTIVVFVLEFVSHYVVGVHTQGMLPK